MSDTVGPWASSIEVYIDAKTFFATSLAVERDTLHVLGGVAIFLLVAAIVRRPVTHWFPLSVVLAVSIVNEVVDLNSETWPEIARQYGESLKDLVLTMALPGLIATVARLRPQLFGGEVSAGRSG